MDYIRTNELETLLANHDVLQGIVASLNIQLGAVTDETEAETIEGGVLSRKVDGQPASVGAISDKTGNIALRSKDRDASDGAKEICEDILLLTKVLKKMAIALNTLRPREKDIIDFKYFQGMTWQQAADKAFLSLAHTRRIASEVLPKLVTVCRIELEDYKQIKNLLF